MKERTLRTKIKSKDQDNGEPENNSNVKHLKIYHKDIIDEEESYNININNKAEIE